MKVGLLIKLLKSEDPEAEVHFELLRNNKATRYSVTHVKRPGTVTGRSSKVLLSNE